MKKKQRNGQNRNLTKS